MRSSSTFDRKWIVMVIVTFAMMVRSCKLLLGNVNAMKTENLIKKKSPSMSGFPLPLSTRLLSLSASSPSLSYLPLPPSLSCPFYVVIFMVRPFSLVFREKSWNFNYLKRGDKLKVLEITVEQCNSNALVILHLFEIVEEYQKLLSQYNNWRMTGQTWLI